MPREKELTKQQIANHADAIMAAVAHQLPEDEPDYVRRWVYETAVAVMWRRLIVARSITRADVVARIKRAQGDRSLRALAREWEIDVAHLSRILSGENEPGPRVLERIGLRSAVFYSVVSDA